MHRLDAAVDITSYTFSIFCQILLVILFLTVLQPPPACPGGILRYSQASVIMFRVNHKGDICTCLKHLNRMFYRRSRDAPRRPDISVSGRPPNSEILLCTPELSAFHLLEKLDEQPGVALHHVRLQVGHCDQLVEQLDEEDVVLFAEPAAIQLQKPVWGGVKEVERKEKGPISEGLNTSCSYS